MSRKQFRLLLVLNVVLEGGATFLHFTGRGAVPDVVKELEPLGFTHSMTLTFLAAGLGLAITVAALVGIVGMFFFWSPARYIYAASLILMIVTMFVSSPWGIFTRWSGLLGEFEKLLDGVILTLALAGPAKDLFVRGKGSTNSKELTNGG